MSDEAIILVCSRTLDNPLVEQIEGSVAALCSSCGAQVWVAPSGQAIVRDEGAVVVCVPCAADVIDEDLDPEVMPMRPEQLDELTIHMRRRR